LVKTTVFKTTVFYIYIVLYFTFYIYILYFTIIYFLHVLLTKHYISPTPKPPSNWICTKFCTASVTIFCHIYYRALILYGVKYATARAGNN